MSIRASLVTRSEGPSASRQCAQICFARDSLTTCASSQKPVLTNNVAGGQRSPCRVVHHEDLDAHTPSPAVVLLAQALGGVLAYPQGSQVFGGIFFAGDKHIAVGIDGNRVGPVVSAVTVVMGIPNEFVGRVELA